MRRIFLTISVTARMATGRSFGPISTRATTPISAISDMPKSNMAGQVLSSAAWGATFP